MERFRDIFLGETPLFSLASLRLCVRQCFLAGVMQSVAITLQDDFQQGDCLIMMCVISSEN